MGAKIANDEESAIERSPSIKVEDRLGNPVSNSLPLGSRSLANSNADPLGNGRLRDDAHGTFARNDGFQRSSDSNSLHWKLVSRGEHWTCHLGAVGDG